MPQENTGKKENRLEEVKLKLDNYLTTCDSRSQGSLAHGAQAQCKKLVEDNPFQYAILKKSIPSFVSNAEEKGKDILNLCFVQLKVEVPFCFLLSFS